MLNGLKIGLLIAILCRGHATLPLTDYEALLSSNILTIPQHSTQYVDSSIIQLMEQNPQFLRQTNDVYAQLADDTIIEKIHAQVESHGPSADYITQEFPGTNGEFFQMLLGLNQNIKAVYFKPTAQQVINLIVSHTSRETYEVINNHWEYYNEIAGLRCESPFWKPASYETMAYVNGEEKLMTAPTLLWEGSPGYLESLLNLITSPSQLECAIALSAVKSICLARILGPCFNKYVTDFSNVLKKRQKPFEVLFHEICDPFLTTRPHTTEEDIPIGAILYIANLPSYRTYKPRKVGVGENVIYLPNGYVGLGPLYGTGPQTLKEIREFHWDSFAKFEDLIQNKEEHLNAVHIYQNNPSLFETAYQNAQEDMYDYFDWVKFSQLRK